MFCDLQWPSRLFQGQHEVGFVIGYPESVNRRQRVLSGTYNNAPTRRKGASGYRWWTTVDFSHSARCAPKIMGKHAQLSFESALKLQVGDARFYSHGEDGHGAKIHTAGRNML